MTKHLERQQIDTLAKILPAIEIAPVEDRSNETDRSFGLPPALHIGLCAVFVVYLAVLGIGLASPGLIIPMAIFAIFTIAAFAVPALWVRMGPINPVQSPCWSEFKRSGLMIATGPASAGAVIAQMYVVPLVVLGWGIAMVAIWGATA